MTSSRLRLVLLAIVVVVAGATALGIGVRATYGAQTTADEPQYLLSALSLWEDGDLDIANQLRTEAYRPFHEVGLPEQTRSLSDGRRVSPHDPLLPLLLAVPMGLGGWVGAKAALAVMAGTLAGLFFWVAHRRFGVGPLSSLVVTGVIFLSPPMAIYGTQVYPELAAALAVTVAIAALTGTPRPALLTVATAMVIALPWLAIKYVPVAAVLALAMLWRAPRKARPWLVVALAVGAVTYVIAHLGIYQGFTPYAAGDHFVGGEFTVVGVTPDLWGRANRLVGLLVDRGFGLAAWQPAYLLLPVAAAGALRRRFESGRLLLAVVGTGWLVATFVALTMHGWWFPGRQLIVVLPAAALLIAKWADTGRARLMVTSALGVLGVGSFAFLVAEGLARRLTWVVDFGSTIYPVYRALASLLPDYMNLSPGMWLRHFVWLAVLGGLAWVGMRSAAPAGAYLERPLTKRERHAT